MTSTANDFMPPLNQIAFSVVDLRLTERWFREGFGLVASGGSRALMRGPLAANVQGLPRVASTCWWLLGRNSWFQLELFQFERPMANLMPADFRPCDIGYTRIGIWVDDFDATLKRLAGLGSQPLSDPLGERGGRRACVRNPDGVYVEIMEDDPLPHVNRSGRINCPSALRSVTLSVPHLSDSAAFFETGIGLKASTVLLHTPEHEALWGMAGATTESRLFDGGEVLIEVVQYVDPAGKPRPSDYRLSDQGILNIAFGARRQVRLRGGISECRSVWGSAQLPTRSPTCRRIGDLRQRSARLFGRDPPHDRPDCPTGSSDSSPEAYTSARIRIRTGSNTGSSSMHRSTMCGKRSLIKTTWRGGSVSTQSRYARKAGHSATAPVPNA